MKFRILIILLSFAFTGNQFAQKVSINQAVGWLESAYVTWSPLEGIDTFKVICTGGGESAHEIDEQLIRNYGSFYRADIPGLAAGNYTIKVIPVVNGQAGTAAESEIVTVEAHDRTGFAFANGRIPGAYKSDGTLKSNAVVLYITQNTKNSVSMDVTGANENPCVGLETILEGYKKGDENRPLAVRLIGQITDLEYMDKGDLVVENKNNSSSYITVEGIGNDATADGWGLRVKNASNVEIRNIGFMNTDSDEGDDLGLQQNNDYIWVHHCDFFYGGAGGDSDQAKGDGALDCKKSTYVTFSFNHFWDTGKSNLLGLSEGSTDGWYITYHHNWYDHSDSRHPRVRYYSAHVYNNYYDGNAKYGVGSTLGSSVFVEGNYFRNCKYPILTSMQGSDVFDASTGSNDYADMPTFSKEDGGTIKAFYNYMTGQKRFVAYGDGAYPNPTVDFDAFAASSRDETIPASVVSSRGSNTYNNFDTDASLMYQYEAEAPDAAKETVTVYAGRMEGGDFQWTFNNSTDDASYAVNTALKTALINYETELVSVQGDGDANGTGGDDGGDNGGDDGGGTSDEIGDRAHNFTLSGLSSDFYTISGNLSDSKGTVNYNDLTLTQCLKIESSTSIDFTASEDAALTLVFNEDFSGSIKIDGNSESAGSGVLETSVTAGTHQITKGDVANIYYMTVVYPSDDDDNGDGGTGVESLPLKSHVCYPNPVDDVLYFDTASELQGVSVYSMNGVLLKSLKSKSEQVYLGDLASGTYMVIVQTEQGTICEIILKK